MKTTAKSASRALLVVLLASNLSGCFLFRSSKTTEAPATPPPAVAAPVAPSADKGDPNARFEAALKLLKGKQPKEASDAFAKLAVDFPEFSGPLTDLGILQAQGKQRAPAIASFEKAVAANPSNVVARNWLGSLYRENNDYARAETQYKQVIATRPDYAPAHLNLGILYDAYLKRPQEALAQYREYQRLAGTDKLIVTAWIKELEAQTAPPPAPATPAAVPVTTPTATPATAPAAPRPAPTSGARP